MKKLRLAKNRNSKASGEDSKVLLVHTTEPGIVRSVDGATVVKLGDESFLQGTLISPDPGHFDDGKKVSLNLRHVISITEFDSVEQFMKRKKGDLKLLVPGNSRIVKK